MFHLHRYITLIYDKKNLFVQQLESRTKSLIGEFPNTYTFAKALGERLLQKHHGDTPLTIVRPSIIGSSWKVFIFPIQLL